jgi:hypothetical protein
MVRRKEGPQGIKRNSIFPEIYNPNVSSLGLTGPQGPTRMVIDVKDLPEDYDVLLSDVHSKDLHNSISIELKSKYLNLCESKEIIREVGGILWGSYTRCFVSLPVSNKEQTRNVIFLIDTGSPWTYISEEVSNLFIVLLI